MYKLTAILFVFVFILSCSLAFAYISGTTQNSISKYEVTVTKVEFSKDGGSSWHTVFEGSETMDIASVDFDAKVKTFVSGFSLEEGTYTKCRLTVSGTFVINGSVIYSDGETIYYTMQGTDQRSMHTGEPEYDADNVGDSTVNNRDDDGNILSYEQTVDGTMTITEDQTTTVKIIMDTNSCLGMTEYEDTDYYIISPEPPDWTFAQE